MILRQAATVLLWAFTRASMPRLSALSNGSPMAMSTLTATRSAPWSALSRLAVPGSPERDPRPAARIICGALPTSRWLRSIPPPPAAMPRCWRREKNKTLPISRRAKSGLLLPQRRKLHGDDIVVADIAGEDAHVTGKRLHAGNELRGDSGVIIRQVAANKLGNQLSLGCWKQLAADLGGLSHVGAQGSVRVDDGAYRGSGRVR